MRAATDPIIHIASFVVQHRADALDALDQALSTLDCVQLAAREGSRSVLLAESASEGALLDQIDTLRQIDGVLAINLVHHHAESETELQQEIVDGHPS